MSRLQRRLVRSSSSSTDDPAYGLHAIDGYRNVLVIDLGARQLDVSLIEVDDGVFQVLATAVDERLGGSKFDKRIVCVRIVCSIIDPQRPLDQALDGALWRNRHQARL